MKITRFTKNNQNKSKDESWRKSGPGKGRYFKVKLFISEYLVDHKIYEAFVRCGYGTGNKNTDQVQASKLFNRVDVQETLREEVDKRCKVLEIKEQTVLAELAKIAFSDIKNYINWNKDGEVDFVPSEALASQYSGAVKSLETKEVTRYIVMEMVDEKNSTKKKIKRIPITIPSYKIELYDKKSALVDIGKHLGMFWEGTSLSKDPAEETKKYQQAMKSIRLMTDPGKPTGDGD